MIIIYQVFNWLFLCFRPHARHRGGVMVPVHQSASPRQSSGAMATRSVIGLPAIITLADLRRECVSELQSGSAAPIDRSNGDAKRLWIAVASSAKLLSSPNSPNQLQFHDHPHLPINPESQTYKTSILNSRSKAVASRSSLHALQSGSAAPIDGSDGDAKRINPPRDLPAK